MKIAVVGAGYVGLSLGVLLARDNEVVFAEIDGRKVRAINAGESPIEDADISRLLARGGLGLRATTDGPSACRGADVVIVATPTDYDESRHSFDVSSVDGAVGAALAASPGALVVVKSTVPVGYTDALAARLPGKRVLFSPEFLREGRALYDNLHPSRVVVGVPQGAPPGAADDAQALARLLLDGAENEAPALVMAAREAEAVKLFANTYLAARVSFFNELDAYAEANGLDARRVIEGVTKDPRIGEHYCNPSFGYGGYCLPKDSRQLEAAFQGIPQAMVSAAVASNDLRRRHVAQRVLQAAAARAGGVPPVVGAYRLTMKSGSDNFRSSAVRGVAELVRAAGVEVVVYEPAIEGGEFDGMRVLADLDEFLEASHVVMANRMAPEIERARDKVYTRDCFYRD